jgi:hypothetical protein
VIPGRRARAFLKEVDPGAPRTLARVDRFAYVALIWVAVMLVVGSLGLLQHADTREEAGHLGFGYPFHYAAVDVRWMWGAPPGEQGPFDVRLNPWEQNVDLRLGYFLLDWMLVAGALVGVYRLGRRVTRPRTSPSPG